MASEQTIGGLSAQEAAARLAAEGPNLLPRSGRRGFVRIVLEVLREPMFALLLGAGVDLSRARRPHAKPSILLRLRHAPRSSITVVQETRTERVLESAARPDQPARAGHPRRRAQAHRRAARWCAATWSSSPKATAFRPTPTVARGHDLLADESLLTGESVPVRKIARRDAERRRGRPGGDDLPYVFSGTLVVRGDGIARRHRDRRRAARSARSASR